MTMEIQNSTEANKIDFTAWFKKSILNVYAESIPLTIKYLCEKLDTMELWCDFEIKQQDKMRQQKRGVQTT